MSAPPLATDQPRQHHDHSGFARLGVPAALVTALAADGVTSPFPIQSATLPDALAGRDILGRGRTGSGKTIAFAVPVVASLAAAGGRPTPRRPRALVLVPTRELAGQVTEVFRPLARATGLRIVTVYGGVPQHRQVSALRQGVDVVIATPGRLEDLIAQRHCDLQEVAITVIDEADHMADLGFLPVVKRLLDQTPGRGQRLMFSATLDRAVDGLVARYLHDARVHSVDPPEASPDLLEHHLFSVQAGHKSAVVADLASGQGRTLLFTRTKHGAKKLARQLTTSGIPAVELHGNLSQSLRQRNLAAFSDGSARVLVATDIAARGIHVDDIALVVHVDPPAEHKTFLHRSGRTARAGAAGAVVTVVLPDQAKDVRTLVRQAGIQATSSTVVPGDPQTIALTGPPAPRQRVPAAVPTVVPQAGPARGGAPSSRRRTARPHPPAGAPRYGAPAAARGSAPGAGRGSAPAAARGSAGSRRRRPDPSARPRRSA